MKWRLSKIKSKFNKLYIFLCCNFQVQERWYEKLHDWEKALSIYTERSAAAAQADPDATSENPDLVLGKMRCMEALGEWQDLHELSGGRININHITRYSEISNLRWEVWWPNSKFTRYRFSITLYISNLRCNCCWPTIS